MPLDRRRRRLKSPYLHRSRRLAPLALEGTTQQVAVPSFSFSSFVFVSSRVDTFLRSRRSPRVSSSPRGRVFLLPISVKSTSGLKSREYNAPKGSISPLLATVRAAATYSSPCARVRHRSYAQFRGRHRRRHSPGSSLAAIGRVGIRSCSITVCIIIIITCVSH